jgi:outer membrane protein TolC
MIQIHQRINNRRFWVILFGMFAVIARAEEVALSLDDCRQRAVEQNLKLANATMTVNASREDSRSAFTQYFPDVSATGLAYNANKGLIEMEMSPEESMSLLKNGVLGGVTLTQPIFAGGQIVNGNKLAKVGVEVSQLQLEQTRKEVLLTVEQYYWQVISLTEKKKTLQAVDHMLQQICSDVEVAVNAGVTTRNDLLQVQLRRNDVAAAMLNLDNALALSRMVLAQYIGLAGTEVQVVPEVSMDSLPTFPAEFYVDHATALLATPEYKLLEQNVHAQKLQQKMTVGKYLPSVAAGVGYMYDNLTDKDHPFGIAFVTGSVPLSGWWGGSHDIRKQKANVHIANNTLTDSSDLLTIRMQHLWDEFRDAYQQLLIARSSIEQSEENLRLNRNYYEAGTATMSDLLDAQQLYQNSRDKWVETYAQFRIKGVEYRQATAQE